MGVCMQRLQRCYICVPGPSSYVCHLHSPVDSFQHAMCLLMYGHLGLHMCMLVTFTLGLALTYLWLLQGTMYVQADLPTCSPLHSCISATCMCGHAAFTCMCMHITFVYMLYFAGEQVVFRDVSCIPMCWGISEGMCTPYVCI